MATREFVNRLWKSFDMCKDLTDPEIYTCPLCYREARRELDREDGCEHCGLIETAPALTEQDLRADQDRQYLEKELLRDYGEAQRISKEDLTKVWRKK